MTISGFLSRFTDARRSGNEWSALCPVCGGAARIWRGEGLLMARCGNGCSLPVILAKLGLRFRDLRVKAPTPRPSAATPASETGGGA